MPLSSAVSPLCRLCCCHGHTVGKNCSYTAAAENSREYNTSIVPPAKMCTINLNIRSDQTLWLQDVYMLFSPTRLRWPTRDQIMFHQVLFTPAVVLWYSCSCSTSVWTPLLCSYSPLSQVNTGPMHSECFPADCTFILAVHLTHCKSRKWNMCLCVWSDGCDPAACWLSHCSLPCPKSTSHCTWSCYWLGSFEFSAD